MSSIYLSSELKSRLIANARRRGFKVERGPSSELKDYVAYLLELDEGLAAGEVQKSSTLSSARGLLSVTDPTNDDAIKRMLEERLLDQ